MIYFHFIELWPYINDSPLLFIILTSDKPEAISEASIVTYADDTTVYLAHSNVDSVYKGLETAADEILLYMRSNCLAAKTEKTKFVMFGRKKSSKIRVEPGYLWKRVRLRCFLG
jgi:hypothetical protein